MAKRTKEFYLRLNAMVDTGVTARLPGEVIEDSEGIPTAMAAPITAEPIVSAVYVTAQELADVGLTPDDVPNLTVIEDTEI